MESNIATLSSDPVVRSLIDLKLVKSEDARCAAVEAATSGISPHVILFRKGAVSKTDVFEAMTAAKEIPFASKLQDLPPWDTIIDDGSTSAKQFLLIGLSTDLRKRMFLLTNSSARDETPQVRVRRPSALLSKGISQGFSFAGDIDVVPGLIDVVEAEWKARQRNHDSNVERSDMQGEFDRIGLHAFQMGASDIHLTGLDGSAWISYRINGELQHIEDKPYDFMLKLVTAAYNTLSEKGSTKGDYNPDELLDATIERTFDIGRLRFRFSNVQLAPDGFDVTMRIIACDAQTTILDITEQGYAASQLRDLDRICSHAHGIVVWVGTTGSGKSTSMAAVLKRLAKENPGKKYRTVEEPVEARIAGVFQTPVKSKSEDGSDFRRVLRQMLRTDLDGLTIGEMRDEPTAHIALQAARTGHLTFSTLHANGAPGAYDRLLGLGVQRHDLATHGLFLGFIFQTLVPTLCPHCKVPAETVVGLQPDLPIIERLLNLIGSDGSLRGIYFRNDEGCQHCRHGESGRTLCAEILQPTPKILKAVLAGDSVELWRQWRSRINPSDPSDMTGRTAFEHALWKMRSGIVCPKAVERAFKRVDELAYDEGDGE